MFAHVLRALPKFARLRYTEAARSQPTGYGLGELNGGGFNLTQGVPSMTHEQQVAYWKQNLLYIIAILAVWFGVSFFAGIMIADQLEGIRLGGFPLGFWFANQGAEVTFVLLIVVYVALMNRLDKKFGVYED